MEAAERWLAGAVRLRQQESESVTDLAQCDHAGKAVVERRILAETNEASGRPGYLIGEKAKRLYFIKLESIDYIESDGNYVAIHVEQDRYISRNTLKNLNTLLAPAGFVRIERSLLINVLRVSYAERLSGGRLAFALRGGHRLICSGSYKKPIFTQIRRGYLP